MRRTLVVLAAALVASALLVTSAPADDETGEVAFSPRTWEVTLTNLTPAGSQPLSPPLVVVHSFRADVWSLGQVASHGVAAIAEDANNAPLEQALPMLGGVKSVATVPGGPIPPGTSRTFTVETEGFNTRLSVVTMLVNTNDAFTGLDSLRLVSRRYTLDTVAYDAGSERNNELEAFIPGPCCNNPFVRDPEGNLVRRHEGITGRGELSPSVYGWREPVARFSITRAG